MKLIIPLITLCLFTGCIEKKVKYYKKISPKDDSKEIIATAYFSDTNPSGRSAIYADLPEKALASLIESYGSDDDTRSKLLSLLTKPLISKKSVLVDDSRVKFSRNFTFSLIDYNFSPADRIYSAHYHLELPDCWEFSNWRGFEIKDRSINVAKVSNVQTRSFNLTGLYTPTHFEKFGESTSVFNNSNVKSIARDLNFELIEVMPIFKPHSIDLYLRAPFPQVNLAGSYKYVVDIIYTDKLKSQEILNFEIDKEDKEGKKQTSVTSYLVKYIPYIDHLDQNVYSKEEYLKPIVRSVEKGSRGAKTLVEDDDKATYNLKETQLNPVNTLVINKKDISLSVNQLFWQDEPIYFLSDLKLGKKWHAKPLVLSSGSESKALKKWLYKNPKNLNYTTSKGDEWAFYTCNKSGSLRVINKRTSNDIKSSMESHLIFISSGDVINRFCSKT